MGDFIVNCSGWFSGWFYFMMRWFWNCLVFLCSLTGSLWKGLLVLGPFFREWSNLWAEQRPVPGGNPDYKGQSSQAGATQLGDILLGEGPGTLTSHHITSCQIYIILYYIILYYIILYYYIILHYIILYYIILYFILFYYILCYYIILYYILLHFVLFYYIVLYCFILYYIVLYCI
jgi:hypothetical protein